MAATLEEALADNLLQFGEGLGYRRLGQAQMFCGPAQVALPRSHDEALEMAEADAGEEAVRFHE